MSTYRFYRFMFRVSTSHIALTSSLMMWLVFNEKFMNFVIKLLKFEGSYYYKWYNSYKYQDKWTKISVSLGICLISSQGNFQLQRFTTSENIAKEFCWSGATFLTHTVYTIITWLHDLYSANFEDRVRGNIHGRASLYQPPSIGIIETVDYLMFIGMHGRDDDMNRRRELAARRIRVRWIPSTTKVRGLNWSIVCISQSALLNV